jgi:alpha-glucosidase
MPWDGDTPPFGFSDNPATWLPMPAEWATLTVQRQLHDADSTLSLYRRALELRRERAEFHDDRVDWLPAPDDALIFRSGGLTCALNAGDRPLPLPDGSLILASGPLPGGELPPNTAAWLV